MTRRLRQWRDDSGVMLVVALLVITTVALVTGVMLSHGWTNFRATVGLRGVAGTSYAADAAGKLAINNLRLGADAPGWVAPTFPGIWDDWVYTNNADGTGCFGVTAAQAVQNSLILNNVYPAAGNQTSASSARVECSPVPGTGIFGGGAGVGINDPDPTDAFARALTTIGTGTLNGMTLKPLGTGNNAPMPMRGGVASKTFIDVDNGALVTDGYVWANGNCVGQIVGSEKICNSPGKVPTPTTPTSPLSSVPTYRDPSAQGCSFQPGFYNNAAALSTAVNACSPAYFASGDYYFDFRDEQHSGTNVWNITTKVIGGQPSGSTNIPGACLNPINNSSVTGVRFVFGANSRIELGASAQVELCGPSNSGNAPMTLYQQQAGTTNSAVTLSNQTGTAAQVTGGKVDNFTIVGGGNMTNAVNAAGGSSLAWLSTKKDQTAALNVNAFTGLYGGTGVPAGADITSATVRVKYTKSSATVPLQVAAANDTATATPVNVSAPDGTGWGTADVTSQMVTLLGTGTYNATKPTLQVRLPGSAKDDTLTIDAITLSVTYVPASLRAATDVTFIQATPNFGGKLVVQGATYAPNGYIDMNPGNSSTGLVAFRWGIVALGVSFKAQPQQLFGYPLVSIPDPGTGFGSRVTMVDLKVYVCVQAGTCASGGKHALTARVMITDPPYGASGAPVPGRRQIKVLSWAEQN